MDSDDEEAADSASRNEAYKKAYNIGGKPATVQELLEGIKNAVEDTTSTEDQKPLYRKIAINNLVIHACDMRLEDYQAITEHFETNAKAYKAVDGGAWFRDALNQMIGVFATGFEMAIGLPGQIGFNLERLRKLRDSEYPGEKTEESLDMQSNSKAETWVSAMSFLSGLRNQPLELLATLGGAPGTEISRLNLGEDGKTLSKCPDGDSWSGKSQVSLSIGEIDMSWETAVALSKYVNSLLESARSNQ